MEILLSFDGVGVGLVQIGNIHSFEFSSLSTCKTIFVVELNLIVIGGITFHSTSSITELFDRYEI